MKSCYSERPEMIQKLDDNSYAFNYNIEEVKKDDNTYYECEQVIINESNINDDSIIRDVLLNNWDVNQQLKMVNDYFEDNPRIDIVGSAYNGDEGLKIIKEGKLEYDLIVLDLIMPKKDGIAVLRDLKENNINRNIIVATSYNAPDTIRKVSEYGVTYYILKPFDSFVQYILLDLHCPRLIFLQG